MEVVTLSDLAPILAAVIGPMLVMVLALMRYQHLDSTKTRTFMYELIEKYHAELKGELKSIAVEIGEIKQRLSYIEGHLRLPSPPVSDGAVGEAQAA